MESPRSTTRVTVRDVARRLKVSHTTVSRSLRNDRRISESVREKVQKTARQMGYRPDPMLAALAHYRRGNASKPITAELAWINQRPNPQELLNFREFDLYWKGAEQEAKRCGFRLEEFIINDDMSSVRVENILRARNIRGVLLAPLGGFKNHLEKFHWDNFCVVRFGHSVQIPRAHLVTSDQLTDGMIAYENMWHKGYRRIGLVSWTKTLTRFRAGYLLGDLDWNHRKRIPPLMMDHADPDTECRMLQSWIKKHKPDAILTDVAEVHEWLTLSGYQVPKDIGLATLSILDGNASAGIDQNSEEIGRAAVQLLISLINHSQFGIPETCRELLVEGRWVDGNTLPPKPQFGAGMPSNAER